MPSLADAPITIRQLDGVNLADDPAHIGPSFLQRADNWVPDLTFRVSKRLGTALFQSIPNIDRIDAMLRTYDTAGARYLFAAGIDGMGIGHLFVSTNDGPFGQVGADFTALFARYGMAVLGQALYIGNGVGPIRRIDLATLTSVSLTALPLTDDTGFTVVAAADTATNLQTGTYSFAWAVYDTTTKTWVSVGGSTGTMIHTFNLSGTGNSLTFTAPTPALPAGQLYHLFVTFPDAPIETAHDQVPAGLANGATFTIRDIVFASTPVPIAEVGRRGRILVPHRSRIWFAGDQQKPSRLFATSTIIPGLEQEIFDIGDFFPWDAEQPIGEGDGDIITGLAVASLTSTNKSPASPLAIFKQNSTWLFLGDITGDLGADLVQVSGKVGCVAPKTVVNTRWGVVFCGRDSVYLLPASLTEPLDIGWPIAPAIRDLPPDQTQNAFAFYQDGFYKLCLAPRGKSDNVTLWTLDMRKGPGAPRNAGPVPSWWGPHTVAALSAAAVATQDTQRIDRTFVALSGSGDIATNEEPTATEYHVGGAQTAIVSVGKTAALDDGAAFLDKNFQRFRATGRAQTDTTLEVCLLVDEVSVECRTGALAGGGGALWNFALWNFDLWGGPGSLVTLIDVTSGLPGGVGQGDDGVIFGTANRPAVQGRQGEIVFTHRDPTALTLRDLELRYLPVGRPAR